MIPRKIEELRRVNAQEYRAANRENEVDTRLDQLSDWGPTGGRGPAGADGATPRLAFSENAAASNTDAFDCFLDTDTTGESISVYPTVNTTVTTMSLASPRLYDGTPLVVWQDSSGTWRTYVTFEVAGPC